MSYKSQVKKYVIQDKHSQKHLYIFYFMHLLYYITLSITSIVLYSISNYIEISNQTPTHHLLKFTLSLWSRSTF